ncbi:MAG: hypothetical protein RL757_2086 [Bacteroidota bacterium]
MKFSEETKVWFKRLGWGGIAFFVIKGTISTLLLLQMGKCAIG